MGLFGSAPIHSQTRPLTVAEAPVILPDKNRHKFENLWQVINFVDMGLGWRLPQQYSRAPRVQPDGDAQGLVEQKGLFDRDYSRPNALPTFGAKP
jgi:hypothetical protein